MKKLKRIVMIGPVYPFKGGIAHYTSLMFKALQSKYDIKMISFKMQYPKILFKKEQKDFENDSFKIDNTLYEINTINPFNWILVANKIKRLKPDLVIFQWWHPYFAPCFWSMAKILNKVEILFLCHNVFPHERFLLDKFLTANVLKNGNSYIVQSKSDEQDLRKVINNPKYIRAVHPTYNVFKFREISKEESRCELNICPNDKIMLFFGFVREYKGLKYIIEALPLIISKIDKIKLMIVGDFDNEKEKYMKLIKDLNVKDYITIYDNYIPDKEVEKYFMASDVVVLPYESATQSGIVQIAYGFNKPVIATNVGGLPDVVENGKTGYIVEAKNYTLLADAIIKYFNENKESTFKKNIESVAYKYSWDRMVEHIEKLFYC